MFVVLGGIIFVGIFVALPLMYFFIAQPYRMSGNSMLPTYPHNAYILSYKLAYQNKNPQHGDIVIFKDPANLNRDFIKRVVGLPGDKIMIKDRKFYLNGSETSEPYLKANTLTSSGPFISENQEMIIPENQFFLLGDNRDHSQDSRVYGFIPKKLILGKVIFCYFNCSN